MGKLWGSEERYLETVFTNAIPMIVPSSGTIGNNGALSAITALPGTYTSCYMSFPANAIAAGVPAGNYYVVMSSTTAGTIYNNTYTTGKPTIPASPTAFVTTGPGAYVQLTTAITLTQLTLRGGAMGPAGQLIIYPHHSIPSNANNKIMAITFGGSSIASWTDTTVAVEVRPTRLCNRDSVSRQVGTNWAGFQTGSTTPIYTTINTAADVTISTTAQLAVATDYIIQESLLAQVAYG